MMDFEILKSELDRIFNTKFDYAGKNIQTKYMEFIGEIELINPKINAEWSTFFPSGSYFSISKSSLDEKLTIIVTISDRDYMNYFTLVHPEIIKDDLGICKEWITK